MSCRRSIRGLQPCRETSCSRLPGDSSCPKDRASRTHGRSVSTVILLFVINADSDVGAVNKRLKLTPGVGSVSGPIEGLINKAS